MRNLFLFFFLLKVEALMKSVSCFFFRTKTELLFTFQRFNHKPCGFFSFFFLFFPEQQLLLGLRYSTLLHPSLPLVVDYFRSLSCHINVNLDSNSTSEMFRYCVTTYCTCSTSLCTIWAMFWSVPAWENNLNGI